MIITNLTRKLVVADQADYASSLISRSVGLLARHSFEKGQALIIPKCNSIHTCWMRFPIDVMFIRGNTVVKLIPSLKPFRFAWVRGADAVIELPTGTIADTASYAGDTLAYSS